MATSDQLLQAMADLEIAAITAKASLLASVAATQSDAAQTALDKIATTADRVQTGLDRIATAADVLTVFNKQPLDTTLTALSDVTTAADQIIYATASDMFSVTSLTAFGRSLIDDANASDARTTLGLGTAATTASTDYAPSSHTHSYQAADGDLLAIGGLAGLTGYLKKTAADAWTLDTNSFEVSGSITTHAALTTGVHGLGTMSQQNTGTYAGPGSSQAFAVGALTVTGAISATTTVNFNSGNTTTSNLGGLLYVKPNQAFGVGLRVDSIAGASKTAALYLRGTNSGSTVVGWYAGANAVSTDGSFDIYESSNTYGMSLSPTGALTVTGAISATTTATFGSVKSGTGSLSVSATPATMFSVGEGMYLVFVSVGSGAATYGAFATVIGTATDARIVTNDPSNVQLTVSGQAVQVAQTAGGSFSMTYTYVKIA